MDVDAIESTAARLRAAGAALRARPYGDIVASLGRVGARFLDGSDSLRRRALDGLPGEAHVSPAMAAAILDGMARDWTRDRLEALVNAEFDDPSILDGFTMVGDPSGGPAGVPLRRARALGPGLCLQIVSGSVPGVSVHALLRSLLVKSPTLLKPGRGDHLLPTLFAEALAEEDAELGRALAVTYWPGGSEDVERRALAAADLAVVYGSDETVEVVRAMAPATTRIVAYHHRVGVGVVGRGALGEAGSPSGPEQTAMDVARAVALFEQRGCVCPQVVYVEEGGTSSPSDFARTVATAFEALEVDLPSPPPTTLEAAQMVQLRGTLEMLEAGGEVEVHHGGARSPWMVVLESEAMRLPGGSPRMLRVRPLRDLDELASALAPLGRRLQSVGHAGLGDRTEGVVDTLAQAGASRVVPFRALSFPPPWWFHDGRGPLRELIRLVEVEEE